MAGVKTNGFVFPWAALVSSAALFITLAAGGWVLFQTQFNAQYEIIKENRNSLERMQSNLRRDLEAADIDLRQELIRIREALVRRRGEFVEESAFRQFSTSIRDRLDRLDKQLQVLEATRPTTGELQSTARALDTQVNRMEDRVRGLESYIRGDPRPRSVDPTR